MAIVKEKMLLLVSAGANSNKFYHVTLSDTGVVSKRYGRVGAAGVTNTENTGERGFESVIRGKIRKGYHEIAIVSDSQEPTNSTNTLSSIAKTALVGTGGSNSVLDELIDTLVRLNNHDILEASGGMISVSDDGLMKTPLGLIDISSINEAKRVLSSLENKTIHNREFVPLLENYLQLVPQKVGSRKGWYETFFNDNNTFLAQHEFLKQLGESLELREERIKVARSTDIQDDHDDSKYEKLFKLKINVLEDKAEFKRIEKMFETGKSIHHPSSRYKLKAVYLLDDADGLESYNRNLAKMGNEKTLWHGTRPNNVLSILRHKLFIPPVNGKIQIQGRLFGTGLYFGDTGEETNKGLRFGRPGTVSGGASKALNYSVGGVWDRGPREARCFMFLAKGILGREAHPQGRDGHSRDSIQISGKYDSIYAKAKDTYLKNDEIIIWNTEQISMRYLCEFSL